MKITSKFIYDLLEIGQYILTSNGSLALLYINTLFKKYDIPILDYTEIYSSNDLSLDEIHQLSFIQEITPEIDFEENIIYTENLINLINCKINTSFFSYSGEYDQEVNFTGFTVLKLNLPNNREIIDMFNSIISEFKEIYDDFQIEKKGEDLIIFIIANICFEYSYYEEEKKCLLYYFCKRLFYAFLLYVETYLKENKEG